MPSKGRPSSSAKAGAEVATSAGCKFKLKLLAHREQRGQTRAATNARGRQRLTAEEEAVVVKRLRDLARVSERSGQTYADLVAMKRWDTEP